MKKMIVSILAAVAGLAAAGSEAAAQDTPYFKAPVEINGTGCGPSDLTVIGENSATMTIMFSKSDARPSASGLGRFSCNFAIPVHVPSGYRVSLLTATWMGFAEGQTEFTRRYFFAGKPVPSCNLKTSVRQNFHIHRCRTLRFLQQMRRRRCSAADQQQFVGEEQRRVKS